MFCQVAIDSAQQDHASVIQSILENKEIAATRNGWVSVCILEQVMVRVHYSSAGTATGAFALYCFANDVDA